MKTLNVTLMMMTLIVSCGPATNKVAKAIADQKAADANLAEALDSNSPAKTVPAKDDGKKPTKASDTNSEAKDTVADANTDSSVDANVASVPMHPVDANSVDTKTVDKADCQDGVVTQDILSQGIVTVLTYVYDNTECVGKPQVFSQSLPASSWNGPLPEEAAPAVVAHHSHKAHGGGSGAVNVDVNATNSTVNVTVNQ